jgi:hypothetical protein
VKTFDVHPLAELIPPMSDDEFAELREDIKENGLREAVTVFEGKLLDGRHRARACEELEIEPPTRAYEGDDPAEYVISLNLRRRHLTIGQRATAALALLDYEKEQAKMRQAEGGKKAAPGRPAESSPQERGTFHDSEATAKAGKKLGVSRSSVERAARVADDRPDLHEKVKGGELSVGGAFEQMTGRRIKDGTPLDPSVQKPPPPKVGKRESSRSAQRLENLVHTFSNTQMLLREINTEAAINAIKEKERSEWASQLRSVRTDVSRLITALEESR